MELRNCGTRHFIRAIRNGVVLKVCNIDSNQRPAIRFKSLKDVYESEDAKRLQKPHSGLAFDHQQVKDESPCFPVADRTLREIKPEPDEFPCADDDLGSGLDDDTTLKQLKKQLLTKKRKRIPINDNLQQDNAIEKAAQDESDLNVPLINWKNRHSKTLKATKKHKIRAISSSTSDLTIKSEENLVSEWSPQVGREPAPVSRVKAEVPDGEQLECQNKTSSSDASSIGYNEVPNPGLCVNRYGSCGTNEISYDHLEDVVPLSIIFQRVGMSVKLETSETASRESPDVPSVEIEKQIEIQDSHSQRESLFEDPDLFSHSRSSSSVDDMPEERSISYSQVPDMATDGCKGLRQECTSVPFKDRTEADFLNEPNDCQSSLDKNCSSNMVPITPLKTEEPLKSMEDTIADKEQPSTCSITRNELNSEGHIEDELLKAVDHQNTALTTAESEAYVDNMICDSAETVSIPEANQPPESLLSTREAFSPSPQDQLQLVINSDEIRNDLNQNIVLECKEKLFDNQTEKESSLRSDIQYDEATVNHRRNGMVGQRKVIISPRHILRKSQIAKGNLEGPRFSRMLPNLSTGCTSVQSCSEGAIAFTQRQMRDMETLAEKLMNELKSMKDIVEQKLLFEAYRNASLKNDADEVKTVIKNTTRVEEIAKRWVSMMARDCTRFCKIMKMTPDSIPASEESLPREGRKIRFADEAGGELCHIKFFDDVIAAPEAKSDDMKHRRHSV